MLMNISIPAIVAMATPPGGSGGQGSLLSTLLPLLVIFAIFYFLMIRPQQKQQKKHKEMLSALKKGDKVLTRGGMMGTVFAIAEDVITLEVADNVKIKFSRESVMGVEGAAE
jgi:preprotein translocase subunit YajC